MSTTDERVEAGAKMLDERLPGWRDWIDPDSLQLIDGCHCVLGQLFGDYDRGVALLDLDDATAKNLGFMKSGRAYWSTLTNAWKRILA